jgi:hypothetical protein
VSPDFLIAGNETYLGRRQGNGIPGKTGRIIKMRTIDISRGTSLRGFTLLGNMDSDGAILR